MNSRAGGKESVPNSLVRKSKWPRIRGGSRQYVPATPRLLRVVCIFFFHCRRPGQEAGTGLTMRLENKAAVSELDAKEEGGRNVEIPRAVRTGQLSLSLIQSYSSIGGTSSR